MEMLKISETKVMQPKSSPRNRIHIN